MRRRVTRISVRLKVCLIAQIKGVEDIEDGEVRSNGRISKLCSDISPYWKNMRSMFEYTTLCVKSVIRRFL